MLILHFSYATVYDKLSDRSLYMFETTLKKSNGKNSPITTSNISWKGKKKIIPLSNPLATSKIYIIINLQKIQTVLSSIIHNLVKLNSLRYMTLDNVYIYSSPKPYNNPENLKIGSTLC